MSVEVFLDETPGETRGVIARDGRFETLLIQRDDDVAAHRLGARSVGRVVRVEPALKGAFVDLGAGEPFGFLPLKGGRAVEGEAVEVEVMSEPREAKGPALRRTGAGTGGPRLIEAGPDVRAWLERLAPGVTPIEGLDAIQAALDAEEEALAPRAAVPEAGLTVTVERTRALVAVDLDLAPGRGGRDRANRLGLAEAARLIRLRRWGGLVALDLIGAGQDGGAMIEAARSAFSAEEGVVVGPVNRFGVLMLSLPWRRTPLEEVLNGPDGRPSPRTRAQAVTRGLRRALLTDPRAPVFEARCAPEEAELAAGWVEALGPRARLVADPTRAPGRFRVEETRP